MTNFSHFLRQQEAAETHVPDPIPVPGISNGEVEDVDVDAVTPDPSETSVAMETEEPVETGPIVGPPEKPRALPGHPCGMCNRMFMSMQGLRSHERSHSAVALVNRSHKYSCQFCHFASPFRHK